MNKIYFDEAGNTGADLLNSEQKTFVLCSNSYTEEEAKVLNDLFESKEELHFFKLKKSSKGRKSIIALLNHSLISEKNIVLYIVNKDFVTIAQIVNQLVETFYYNNGVDIQKGNSNIITTQLMYFLSKSSWDVNLFQTFLRQFIEMFRIKDNASIHAFYSTVDKLYDAVDDEDKYLIGPIIGSKIYIVEILKYVDKFSLDVTLSCFLVLCNSWYKKLNKKFDVIFDNSKQLEHYLDFIQTLQNLHVPEKEIGYGSRKMTFPLQINHLKLTNSEEEVNIQISDIIASSVAFMFNNKNSKHQKFVDQIKISKIAKLTNTHAMIPSTLENANIESNCSGESIVNFFENNLK